MNIQELTSEILRRLYLAQLDGQGANPRYIRTLARELEEPLPNVQKAVQALLRSGQVESSKNGQGIKITVSGVIYIEEDGMVDRDIIQRQNRARFAFLRAMAQDEKSSWVDWHDVKLDGAIERLDVQRNIHVLEKLSLLEFRASLVTLTKQGYDAAIYGVRNMEPSLTGFAKLCH